MKPVTTLAFLLSLALTTSVQVSHGVVKEGLTRDSKILGAQVRYTIYSCSQKC